MKNYREKIKQERTNQDRTKIGPYSFLLQFSIFLLEIMNIASQLSCEAMLKILSEDIEKYRIKSKIGPFLLNLCHSYTLYIIHAYQSIRTKH